MGTNQPVVVFNLHLQMALTSSSSPPGRNTPLVVPPELLTQIFSFNPPLSIQSPANYTQVCCQWRAVARALPEIWTTLTIETPTKLVQTRADVISFEAALTDWVSCSSNLTIDFTIRDRPNSRWFDPEDWNTLYVRVYKRIVVRYPNKWRRLITPNSWNAWNFLSKFQTQPTLSALEELTISVHVRTVWERYSSPPFLGSRHLHRLHLNISDDVESYCSLGHLISETVNALTVNSAGHGGIYGYYLKQLLALEQLQHITHLSLSKICWLGATSRPLYGMITLKNLQELVVNGSISGLCGLLAMLTAPSLLRLGLSATIFASDQRYGPIVGPALLSFMRRKRSTHLACGLLTLALTGLSSDDWHQAMAFSSLFDILSTDAASTIQELHIQSDVRFRQPITASLMEMLRYDSENPSNQILPHLTTFSAYDLYDSSLPAQSFFADFVHSRWWPDDSKRRMPGVAKLERVVLKSCRLTQTTEERLRICCEGGLSDKWPDANQFADTCDRWFQAV
ncbi:hypothetical protein F5880DRAFT_1616242 [Lentinula raphanica]|nr:hypothetical protein F5880DRAFT_1616242 [Lentinula raphanica]